MRSLKILMGWAVLGYLAARLYEVSQRRYPIGDVRNPAVVQIPVERLEDIAAAIHNGRRTK